MTGSSKPTQDYPGFQWRGGGWVTVQGPVKKQHASRNTQLGRWWTTRMRRGVGSKNRGTLGACQRGVGPF